MIETTRQNMEDAMDLITMWGGTADIEADWERLDAVDVNDETQMKDLIRADIWGFYAGEAVESQREAMLRGLKHMLKADTNDINRLFNSSMVRFDPPEDNPRKLMIWIKEVFEEHQIYVTDYPDFE